MIRGYANHPSVLQGEALRLHVASDQGLLPFQIWFYRQGERLEFKAQTKPMLAHARPLGAPDRDWNWPIYEYPIPCDWESGAYVALFVPIGNEAGSDPVISPLSEAAALFVVKSRTPNGKILYKLPLFTYHAYNEIGDPCGSFYTGGYSKLTLHRPGAGVGGRPWDHYFPDFYDASSPRQTFWHWDARFIGWLERTGIAVDYCTDLDIHKNLGNFLPSYRLLLSAGHDEYWSEAMRRNVEAFVETGGNVAFFSGNICWWRVHLADGNSTLVCDKTSGADDNRKRDQWFDFDPENRLTGVSHRNGGGHWWGRRDPLGYTVQHATHWIFEGTGLRDGDVFGADHALVGYECDGAAVSDRPDENGFVVPRHDDGTPETFTILGIGRLGPEWAQDPEGFPGGRTATMGIYNNNGIVFTAATTDWPRVLAAGEPHAARITENVLRRLGSGYAEHPAVQPGFSKLPPKNARASRLDRSARGTRGGCRTAGRHPRRHAKSNLFAARRRPVRVPRDRRRSPSRPARRARSTRRAWPRSRAQYFEPATRAEVGAMLTADPDTLTAHDIASGATWADRYRDSDRGGSRQRYEQTRQWHFVNIELDGPNLDRACFGHPRLPAAVPASSGLEGST